MANKNLIRRMRQLLILVLILAMTMSFATMTAMADKPSNKTVHIKLSNEDKALFSSETGISLTINDIEVTATLKGKQLDFDLDNNGLDSFNTKIPFTTFSGKSGMIILQDHEGNDHGEESIKYIDNGANNYDCRVEWYNPTQETGTISITKVVSGLEVDAEKEFTFNILKGETVVDTVSVKSGNTSKSKELSFGTYTIEEVTNTAAIDGYEVKVTYNASNEVTLNKETAYVTVIATNTYTKKGGSGGDGNGGNGNGGTVTPLPPDQNLEDPDTPNTPAEPVEPSEKPFPDDKHTVTEVPKTGDAGADALALNLLLLSISALTGMAFYLRRKMTDR